MSRGEWEALYGGAAGGGKSDALVIEALRQVEIPHYKGLILRKTYPQLDELIDKSENYYPRVYPRAKYNDSKHTWTFPSGAKVVFGSMQYTKDRLKYQGKAYDFIGFDELTHFTWEEYSYLFSRCRPNGPGTRCYIRATANPGGVGHGWVKDRFITAAPPMTTIWTDITYPDENGKDVTVRRSRVFVPARVYDNPALLRNDPSYVANLASMDRANRAALLDGDWNSFTGQVFEEWRDDPAHYKDRVRTHVIDPFYVPETWRIYRGFDWGYSRPFAVGWYAADTDGGLIKIRELYGCTGEPNVGVKWPPDKVAGEIRRVEAEDPNLKGKRVIGIADPAIFASDGTESIGSIMERAGVFWERGDHQRIAGKMQIHRRLAFDENGKPKFQVFNTCRHTIRTMPGLVYDQTDTEDVDTKGEDHIYDETRYVCMANPMTLPPNWKPTPREWNPLEEPKYDGYEFYRRF